jgi:hypothetical protein
MGENGGRTTGQVLSHGTYACLAWCFMFLAHIHRVGSAGLAVTDDRNGRCRKILYFCRAKPDALHSQCVGAFAITKIAANIDRRHARAPHGAQDQKFTVRVH